MRAEVERGPLESHRQAEQQKQERQRHPYPAVAKRAGSRCSDDPLGRRTRIRIYGWRILAPKTDSEAVSRIRSEAMLNPGTRRGEPLSAARQAAACRVEGPATRHTLNRTRIQRGTPRTPLRQGTTDRRLLPGQFLAAKGKFLGRCRREEFRSSRMKIPATPALVAYGRTRSASL